MLNAACVINQLQRAVFQHRGDAGVADQGAIGQRRSGEGQNLHICDLGAIMAYQKPFGDLRSAAITLCGCVFKYWRVRSAANATNHL